MRELNPNHPVTSAAHDHWHKIVALMLIKLKLPRVEFTSAEIDQFAKDGELNGFPSVVLDDRGGKLSVYLVGEEEAQRLAKREGGLPM